MNETIELYSFADVDRSGKIRWTAEELGLGIVEQRVPPGEHRRAPYTELNLFAQIPTVRFRGEVLVESTAICRALVDAVDAPRLEIARGEAGRQAYHYWLALFGENFEARLVECTISKAGILPPEYFTLHEKALRRKLAVAAKQLPASGYLCGERFSLADICAGYSLRLALGCGLLSMDEVEPYLSRLRERSAAVASRIFASLDA